MSKTQSVEWPPLRTRAWVRTIDYAADLATLIEDLDGNKVSISAPFLPSGILHHDPKPGAEVFLYWADEGSVTEIPIEVVSATGTKLRLWHCKPIGDANRVQRRSYVRVPTAMNVKLHLSSSGLPARATTINISEGGLCLAIDRMQREPGALAFEVEFELPTGPMRLEAETAWTVDREGQDFREVGIRFLNIEPKQADLIRRHVFTLEIEQRRRMQ